MHLQVNTPNGVPLLKVSIEDYYKQAAVIAMFNGNERVDGHFAVRQDFDRGVQVLIYDDDVAWSPEALYAIDTRSQSWWAIAWRRFRGTE